MFRVCYFVYSFKVVEGRQDDLVPSSDQTHCGQQLQDQSLCPDEENASNKFLKSYL